MTPAREGELFEALVITVVTVVILWNLGMLRHLLGWIRARIEERRTGIKQYYIPGIDMRFTMSRIRLVPVGTPGAIGPILTEEQADAFVRQQTTDALESARYGVATMGFDELTRYRRWLRPDRSCLALLKEPVRVGDERPWNREGSS